jgi:hypothetical protein
VLQLGNCVDEQPRPVSHWNLLQDTSVPQAPLVVVQVTSHAHDWPQLTPRHEFCPVQLTLHLPMAQVTPRHELLPEHCTSHVNAPWGQMTPLRHEFVVLQRTSQLKPAGQVTTTLVQTAPAAQSMMHLLPEHEVHCDGQRFASIAASAFGPPSPGGASMPMATHRPSLHVRPLSQSALVAHSYWPLRWLIEQLLAARTARKRPVMQTAIHFMASLRS